MGIWAGIIFDFNGVIVDDYLLQKEAWSRISQMLRGAPVTDQEMVERIRGVPTAKTIDWMGESKLSNNDKVALSQKKVRITRNLFETSPLFQLAPGLENFLDKLVKRDIPRTIATSQTRPVFQHLAERLGLEKRFDIASAICYDGSYPGKPAPDAYILAAKAIGIPPENCIVFEDAPSGIGAASNAGIRNIIAIGRDEQLKELRKLPGVVKTVHSFNELDVDSVLGLLRDSS